jgi:hypothetical protein
MTAIYPLGFQWDGEAMIPLQPRLADKYYVVGETYRMIPEEPRSTATHNHQFAEVAEAHSNLPEDLAVEFPTADHLRKYALIKAGYCDKASFVCSSKAEAVRLAAFLKPIDDYSIVTVDDCVVTRYTAQSQSRRAMGAKTFQDSKTAVLEIVAAMIGVQPEKLKSEAGRAA